jgi:hypothetical protein
LKDGSLRPASWCGDSFLFLRQLRSYGRGVQLEIVIWDPTQQLESDTSCLHTGLKANFPDVTKNFHQFIQTYVDYYGILVFMRTHILFAAIE